MIMADKTMENSAVSAAENAAESASRLPRIMLIGEHGCGKTTIIRTLSGLEYKPKRALAVEYFHNFVDSPSEFLENRRFRRALITASNECSVLVFIVDATRSSCQMAPGFATMFNRRVLGVITKCDHPDANRVRARKFLRNTGVLNTIEVGFKSGEGVEELKVALGIKLPA